MTTSHITEEVASADGTFSVKRVGRVRCLVLNDRGQMLFSIVYPTSELMDTLWSWWKESGRYTCSSVDHLAAA